MSEITAPPKAGKKFYDFIVRAGALSLKTGAKNPNTRRDEVVRLLRGTIVKSPATPQVRDLVRRGALVRVNDQRKDRPMTTKDVFRASMSESLSPAPLVKEIAAAPASSADLEDLGGSDGTITAASLRKGGGGL